jgi:hypothetical protein
MGASRPAMVGRTSGRGAGGVAVSVVAPGRDPAGGVVVAPAAAVGGRGSGRRGSGRGRGSGRRDPVAVSGGIVAVSNSEHVQIPEFCFANRITEIALPEFRFRNRVSRIGFHDLSFANRVFGTVLALSANSLTITLTHRKRRQK